MVQELDQTIRMPHTLATNLVTKVTLVATCRVGQAQPTRATTLGTRVEDLATRLHPLSQVATSLLFTKVVVVAMLVVHRSSKGKQVTQATKAAVTTTTMLPCLPTRGGMGLGGITNRELLKECRIGS
jgi:hypothetical protein